MIKTTRSVRGGTAAKMTLKSSELSPRILQLFGAAACLSSALICALMLLVPAVPLFAQRADRPALSITGYVIDAELDTATHHLTAKTIVSFTAPENLELVAFGFHPALKVTKITDENGKVLTGERSADGTIRVAPAAPFTQGKISHWTFEYEGVITDHLSPLPGALVPHDRLPH
jgi:hypothetical protein